jgi:hypothetical protein
VVDAARRGPAETQAKLDELTVALQRAVRL